MNQLYRAILMPKKRLVKKILGHKEIYATCIRKLHGKEEGIYSDQNVPFKNFFHSDNCWFADPVFQNYKDVTALFTEQFNMNSHKGAIACSILEGDTFTFPQVIIEEEFHMSFPMTFLWNDEIYMIPETSADSSIRLYKANSFPYKWDLEKRFPIDKPLVDSVIFSVENNKITVLASEINTTNGLKAKFTKYIITRIKDDFEISFDEKFNLKQKFSFKDRNAGRIINTKEGCFLPTQISSNIDYGVYLNFRNIDIETQIPTGIAKSLFINQIQVEGIQHEKMIGIHSYDKIGEFEVIDLRYLE